MKVIQSGPLPVSGLNTTMTFFDTEAGTPPPTLDLSHQAAVESALKMQDREGEVPPIWTLVAPRKTVVLMTAWNNDQQKNHACHIISNMLHEPRLGILHYSLVSEAWVAGYDKDVDIHSADYLMPSQRPDREEVLFAFSFDRDGGKLADVYKMHRDARGKIDRRDKTTLFEDFKDMSGRMWDLFTYRH